MGKHLICVWQNGRQISQVSLATHNSKRRCILYLDSLGGKGKDHCNLLRRYINLVRHARDPTSERLTTLTLPKLLVQTMHQTNSVDCGVFVWRFFEQFFKVNFKVRWMCVCVCVCVCVCSSVSLSLSHLPCRVPSWLKTKTMWGFITMVGSDLGSSSLVFEIFPNYARLCAN